jgi:hypothetical protein
MSATEKPKRPKKAAAGGTAKPEQSDAADWTWANPKSLKVEPEFRRLIPLQSKEEYRALSDSVKEEGCRDPLLVWKGHNVVLDGHTRRDLCIEHDKKAKVREIDLPDDKAATAFILRIQRQRRNLTREALSYLRGTEYNAVKQLRGGNRRGGRSKDQGDPMNSTARQLAEKFGVSEMTVKRDGVFAQVIDRIVAEYGDPEAKRKLLGADVRLTHGLARQLLKMPPEQRKAVVRQLVETGEYPRAKKKERPAAHQPKQIAQGLVARLKAKGDEHALAVLEQMARLLGREVGQKSSDK